MSDVLLGVYGARGATSTAILTLMTLHVTTAVIAAGTLAVAARSAVRAS